MQPARPFDTVARLPAPGDNAAIAVSTLEAGSRIVAPEGELVLEHAVLEGHRFALRPVAEGEALLSWGLPFGFALRNIAAGAVLCNRLTLEALRERRLDVALPERENFRDPSVPFDLTGYQLAAAPPPLSAAAPLGFEGYARGAARGVGTRNALVLLGVSSRAASYVRALEARLGPVAVGAGIEDGAVAVAHTEGGTDRRPNNAELLLRTLAGFVVHPNVGAVLIVEAGGEALGNAALERFLRDRGYPLDEVPHAFLSLSGDLGRDLARGEARVRGWLERVAACRRSPAPASALKIALQCGGSDAFSGVSGNPLAAWVAAQVIRSGGAANLAETDELIGAEAYLLQRVRDQATARAFVATVERFRRWAARHGASPEGNPSGGNRFRGLYNITLKSLGAAMKRDPEVRLEHVIDYAAPLPGPGLTFMDSPGNDLESVAGQVASGANLIFFVTGNGSITNFPFVPTLKFVTTTPRYELLRAEMDVNAGAYLDGEPLERVGERALALTLEAASGRRTAGERAGHAQVQIWRDWPLAAGASAGEAAGEAAGEPDGAPLAMGSADGPAPAVLEQVGSPGGPRRAVRGGPARAEAAAGVADGGGDRGAEGIPPAPAVALVLPTSLCAGQIGLRAAERLNRAVAAGALPFARAVSLFHTEGCGASGGASERLYVRTLLGYAVHPLVGACLFLEHGCEKTHNDYLRARLREAGLDPERFGWASIQLDGGIDGVLAKIEQWFAGAGERDAARSRRSSLPAVPGIDLAQAGAAPLRLGLVAEAGVGDALLRTLAATARQVVMAGGTVVLPQGPLLAAPAFAERLLAAVPSPSLAYGQRALKPGLHVMQTPTAHGVEVLSGLGATGVAVAVAAVIDRPLQAHPLVPLLQVAAQAAGSDLDLLLQGEPEGWSAALLARLQDTVAGSYTPKLLARGYTDFQISRGRLGISL